MKRSSTAVLLTLSLLAAGCAGRSLRREDPRDQEIQELRARLLAVQRQSAVNEVEVARLRQQVAELEQSRPGGPRASAPAPLPAAPTPPTPPTPKPAAPARPATTPPKPASTPSTRASSTPAKSDIEEADIEVPTQQPARPQAPQTLPRAAAEPLRPNPAVDAPAEGSGPATQALYDRGYTLFNQGRFVDAEASFQRFLQANPDNELADNAQYWIGECRYSRGDLRGALSAFRQTVERYPKGNKVSDALLKAGQCLEGTGDIEGARTTYREVIRRFPGTVAATVAEERNGKLR
jgi:tol-pal system protein YbgF